MSKSLPTYWSKAVSSAAITCLALVFLFSGIACVEVQDAASKLKDKAEAATVEAVETIKSEATTAIEAGSAGSAGDSIKVGDKFPSLNLKDQAGEAFDLSGTLKKGPVALVIFRSADW